MTSLVYALTWAFGAAVEQSPESENHRPLVFLHHLANTFGFADRNKLVLTLTLKQTQRLKGSVARTIPQEIRVRTSPQRPTPDSLSSAEVGHSWHHFFSTLGTIYLHFGATSQAFIIIIILLFLNCSCFFFILNTGIAIWCPYFKSRIWLYLNRTKCS